jgi:hypothetical protein
MTPYTPPKLDLSAFNCPHCGAFAKQFWGDAKAHLASWVSAKGLKIAFCAHCNNHSVWQEATVVFPDSSAAPLPNKDLPPEMLADYAEARSILSRSPRGAAALLRLVIQKLCKHLGEPGKDINTDIGNLVKKGLPSSLQKAFDTLRVIGNNAVHPGQIDLKDDAQTAHGLFQLVNIIAEKMISEPKEIDRMYEMLPESATKAIGKRDGGV